MVRVLFLHPDLGIGGAERLVVDAALALKQHGHEVSFLTNHHDRAHCFKETCDGTLPVTVVGDWLPRTICGRFYAFCAYLRMIYMAFYTCIDVICHKPIDVIFCDQISIGIPLLRLVRPRPKILFYCHFPDQLLVQTRATFLQRVYRAPLNYLEEFTTGLADTTLVNSKFTLRVFRETFQRLRVVPEVLYPSLNTQYFDEQQRRLQAQPPLAALPPPLNNLPSNTFIFLDINRYERKKNHALALLAFREFRDTLPASDWKRCRLIIAGGYDTRLAENVEHHNELQRLMLKLSLNAHVDFLLSPKDSEKVALLYAAHALIYTPANEHFGIVPLEAMYMAKPVIAANSGGPTETVVDKSTGFLCETQPTHFADAMLQLFRNDTLRERMGALGHKRVQQKFSFDSFSARLNNIISELLADPVHNTKKQT